MNDTTTTTSARPVNHGRVRRWATALAVATTTTLMHAVGVAPAEALPTVDLPTW